MNKQIYISLLRGINVSGKNKIKMADLKVLYESLHFENIQTYIQSGNVTFKAPTQSNEILSKKIQNKIAEVYNYQVPVLIKTALEFKEIVNQNDFYHIRQEDIKRLHVTLLSIIPTADKIQRLQSKDFGVDEFNIKGKSIYLFCPNGYGRTKLSNNFLERTLKVQATTRNWKTMLKLRMLIEDKVL